MLEAEQIVALWRRARFRGETVYLATVVHVEGSSYRKPGARMLVTSGGERAGTLSGGCLEADVARKIAWLTSNGAAIECYRSSFDDDNEGVPYGLGCGGTIWILLETGPGAHAVLEALERAVDELEASVIVVSLGQGSVGTAAVLGGSDLQPHFLEEKSGWSPQKLAQPASDALQELRTIAIPGDESSFLPAFLCAPIALPLRLTVFGAGDDAQPIVRFAAELGWRIAVADGRSHLLRRERFPQAAELRVLSYDTPEEANPAAAQVDPPPFRRLISPSGVRPGEFAAILTHSYEQDRALLEALLPEPLGYLGILGPRHRTARLLSAVAPGLGFSEEECFARLHSPVGLDFGTGEPSVIALAIIAQMQATFLGRAVHVEKKNPGKSTQETNLQSVLRAAAAHG